MATMQENTHAREALRSPFHLACISGPDTGVLASRGVLGRAGALPLSDPQLSRSHALLSPVAQGMRISPDKGNVHIRSPFFNWRLLPPNGAVVKKGQHLRVGKNLFCIRSRPHILSWPAPQKEKTHVQRSLRTLPFFSLIFMLSFGLWRFHSVVPLPLFIGMGCAVGAAIFFFCVFFLRKHHLRRKSWDGATLALILSSLPPTATTALPTCVEVWTEKATRLTRRVRVHVPDSKDAAQGARALGLAGPHSLTTALWCAGQAAAQCGGATITIDGGGSYRLGAERLTIHITTSEECPHCTPTSPPALHICYAESDCDLPTWCDQICTVQNPPVGKMWWWQIAHLVPRTSLPSSLLWTPPDPNDQFGTLDVLIGQDAAGEAHLDLVNDGPHALVAGCTGSGKSEALLTWLLSICARYSPAQVRLILIDYKGGATFSRIASLPHTHALLTDLAPQETDRALRGIEHLLCERERRMAALHVPDLSGWEKAHAARPDVVEAPPARLIIAIDEFRVLSDTHPKALDVLMRLAAQGRSLGLHLIAATQRPAGAVHAHMRANMDIRLALRCVTAADSIDVIGSAQASQLPRIPGRGVLADSQLLQVSYISSIDEAVAHCQHRWGSETLDPLWAPPLSEHLTWEEVEAYGPHAVGMLEGIDAHRPLMWAGEHVEIQAGAHEGGLVRQWASHLALRIAECQGVPLHAISADPPPEAASQIIPSDASACAALIEGVSHHGECVLLIDDAPRVRSLLGQGLGAARAEALWTQLLAESRDAGVHLVVGEIGRFTSSSVSMGAFGIRLIRAHDGASALHAGIDARAAHLLGDNQVLLCRPGQDPALVAIPVQGRPHSGGISSHWRVRTADQALSEYAKSTLSVPIVSGDDYTPYQPDSPLPWVIIGSEEDQEIVRSLHRYLGWESPTFLSVIPPELWARITRWNGARVLAIHPTDNVIHALIHSSTHTPASVIARQWNNTTGVICDKGCITNIQLTEGSVAS